MKISLDIPKDAFKTCYSSPEEFASALRKAAAIYWYQRTEISQERSAQIAGLNRKEFMEALAREKVDVFVVDFDDLKRELELG
ncbi:hypothetical protein WA1_08215 [Scytonema hofmannii PCC 7110]|uniref:Uncharacterized protein n=1 Tax=Scytonema hofmannii PCC 7110 TaxID=128403 RepID=A0A139WRS6_9CYAN|nr:UPF0175 family protein [Scytonema hofmannii]KYC35141.1 hypothetical protein WA1_08215 [Scytonema hofmannii PCC 7110]